MIETWIKNRRRTKCSICEKNGKINLKRAILKISGRLNIQWLREDYDKELNSAKENGTIENIEELYKLWHIMEDRKVDVMIIGEEWDMLMGQLKALQQSFKEERVKA